MSIQITVNSVQNEAVANSVFEVGDILVINGVGSYILDIQPGATAETVVLTTDASAMPPVGATIHLKKADKSIPMGTESIPGLVTKRVRSYMETPNTATSPDGVAVWDIVDVDNVSAATLFTVGDWVRINGIEYLIQSVTPTAGGITCVTAPSAPIGSASYKVYHYIDSGVIPLATANTPGLVPHTYNHATLRQIDLYVPGAWAGGNINDNILLTVAGDYMKWLCEPVSIISVNAITALRDSGSAGASVTLIDLDTGLALCDTIGLASSGVWTSAPPVAGAEIDAGTSLGIKLMATGTNKDSENLRVSILAEVTGGGAGA